VTWKLRCFAPRSREHADIVVRGDLRQRHRMGHRTPPKAVEKEAGVLRFGAYSAFRMSRPNMIPLVPSRAPSSNGAGLGCDHLGMGWVWPAVEAYQRRKIAHQCEGEVSPHSPDEVVIFERACLDFCLMLSILWQIERGGHGGPGG